MNPIYNITIPKKIATTLPIVAKTFISFSPTSPARAVPITIQIKILPKIIPLKLLIGPILGKK